jgi:hypothetical protein
MEDSEARIIVWAEKGCAQAEKLVEAMCRKYPCVSGNKFDARIADAIRRFGTK